MSTGWINSLVVNWFRFDNVESKALVKRNSTVVVYLHMPGMDQIKKSMPVHGYRRKVAKGHCLDSQEN